MRVIKRKILWECLIFLFLADVALSIVVIKNLLSPAEVNVIDASKTVTDNKSEIKDNEILQPEIPEKEICLPVRKAIPILQNPELPTGCEATAATMLLNCYGVDIDKTTFADLLPKAAFTVENNKTYAKSPDEVFIGNPRSVHGYGTFAGTVTATANKILNEKGLDIKAINISGKSENEILSYLDEGRPVCIWVTMNLRPVEKRGGWYLIKENQKTNEWFYWPSHEHCMLLTEYSENTVTVCDPLKGAMKYNRETLFARYNEVGQYAIIIDNK